MALQVVNLVRKRRLTSIYTDLVYVKNGGLAFYGVDRTDVFRKRPVYVDRILRGRKAR